MATMPKCSGPTFRTRGVSSPLGFCSKKVLRVWVERLQRGRDMAFSFRFQGTTQSLNQKAERARGDLILSQPPYHERGHRATNATFVRRKPILVQFHSLSAPRRGLGLIIAPRGEGWDSSS